MICGAVHAAQVLYNGMLENNCSEQASRMAAMESSTKNAKEMLGKLTLSYNRCPLRAHALLCCTSVSLPVASQHPYIQVLNPGRNRVALCYGTAGYGP